MGDENPSTDDRLPLLGTTLLLGPSNVGKTTRTARALDRWLATHGPDGVAVFEFGPAIEHDGTLLGGHLDQFTDALAGLDPTSEATTHPRASVAHEPGGLWYGVVDAAAPRAEGENESAAVALAEANAAAAMDLLDRAPETPRAVFVNDATIAFQHSRGRVEELLAVVSGADCCVMNAFESDELGTDDAVSRQERTALRRLIDGADRVVRLP